MTRVWREAVRSPTVSRTRANSCQSRIADAHHVVDGGDVGLPRRALLRQHAPALTREPVETALALARLLDPTALEPPAVLEPEQRRVQRGQREGQPPARPGLDELADLVAVPGSGLDERQDQHLDAALLEFGTEHGATPPYM